MPRGLAVRVGAALLVLAVLALVGLRLYGVPRFTSAGTQVALAEGARAELAAALRPEKPVLAPAAPENLNSSDPIGHLVVPSLGIDGIVYPVGKARDGSMDVTQNAWTVGWYQPGGVFPGKAGDSVMTCHQHWYTGDGLCRDLHSVAAGAEIDVKLVGGVVRHFKVDDVHTVGWSADTSSLGLFVTSGPARLSIVTCGGTWDVKTQNYSLRVIVNAHLADSTA
jgi:sortase (surface protein transpeptidase)